jgi:hypothetical protein
MNSSPLAQSSKEKAATIGTVRAFMDALPGVEEDSSFGTPGFRVRGKFLARLREDGETLVIKLGFGERAMLMEAEPETFYITDHYRDYPAVLVRLANVDPGILRHLLEQAWRQAAPKRLVAAYDKNGTNKS